MQMIFLRLRLLFMNNDSKEKLRKVINIELDRIIDITEKEENPFHENNLDHEPSKRWNKLINKGARLAKKIDLIYSQVHGVERSF